MNSHRADRCQAAYPDDPTGCCGPVDAVRILDHTGAQATGCVHHAAAMLASITGARVYPGSVVGAAVVAHQLAARRAPFDFHTANPPAPRPGGYVAAAVTSGGRVVFLLGDQHALTVQPRRTGVRLGLRDHARVVEVDLPPAHLAALVDVLASAHRTATLDPRHTHGATTTAEPNPTTGSDAPGGGEGTGTP